MRNFLALVGAFVVTVVCLGWYLGWYRIQSEAAAPGQRKFDVEVNTAKIAADLKKGKEKLSKAIASDDKSTPAPVQPQVEGRPTSFRPGIQFNDDGSISYRSEVTLPPLTPRQ